MAITKPVRGLETLSDANTEYNATSFMIREAIRATVNTSELVQVESAEQEGPDTSPGMVQVSPLVAQTDGEGNAIPVTTWPSIPHVRMQAGVAGIVMKPQPGDKGIAIIQKRDGSGVRPGKTEASTPGSFRSMDAADSVFLPGVYGLPLEVWLMLDPETGDIELSTKSARISIACRESGDIDISTGAGNVSITATDRVVIKAPDITLDGDVTITGRARGRNGGRAVFGSGIDVNGGITNTGGTIQSGTIVLDTHIHAGDSGGDTSPPKG